MKYVTQPFKELVTPEQYANAKKHWTKLMAGEISGSFDMKKYTAAGFGNEYVDSGTHICGTAGCSAGYLPETLVIPPFKLKSYWHIGNSTEDSGLRFVKIIKDYLGIDLVSGTGIIISVWKWCFDNAWVKTDNSATGAGIRMYILYERGLPEYWKDQMQGFKPLMYATELMYGGIH